MTPAIIFTGVPTTSVVNLSPASVQFRPPTTGLTSLYLHPQSTVLTYVEYRAASGVFQNIDPPPPSPPSECVLPPHQRRGVHTRRAVGGWGGGVNILEDARHWIGLLRYNLSTPPPLSSHSSFALCGCNYHLLHEVAGPEEVAGATAHDESAPVDVHNDRPLTVQPGRVHIQAAQGGRGL